MPPLLKFLTGAGLGPRRACFQLIVQGNVTVNGETVTNATQDVDPATDVVIAGGRRVAGEQPHAYVKLNKPSGVLSAVTDSRGRPTISGLVPPGYRRLRLFPVGRLDMDSTGLVLMTNDGDLAYRLMHPSYGYEKEYHVQLREPLTKADLDALANGILLEDQRTAPARVESLRDPHSIRYAVTLAEGRKRQVRRMLAAVAKPPLSLERVRIHTLRLGALAPGEARELTAEEVAALRK